MRDWWEDHAFSVFGWGMGLFFVGGITWGICYSYKSDQKETHEIQRLMAQCLKDHKEYECVAALKQSKCSSNDGMALGMALGLGVGLGGGRR